MRTNKMLALAGSVLVAAAAVSACSSSSSANKAGTSTANLTVVSTTAVPSMSMLPLHVAVENGIFKKRGLDVRVTNGTDFSTFLISLSKGQLDTTIIPQPAFIAGIQKGIKVEAFMSNLAENDANPATQCAYPKSAGISDYPDYAGKTVGVVSLTDTTVASIRYLVQAAGKDPKSVKFIAVPPNQQADQLKAGHIAVACATQPYPIALQQAGYTLSGSVDYDSQAAAAKKAGQTLDSAPNGMTITSQKFGNEHHAQIAAFRDSIAEAITWIKANADAARKIAIDWTGLPAAVINAAQFPLWTSDFTAAQLDAYIAVARANGDVTGELPATADMIWKP